MPTDELRIPFAKAIVKDVCDLLGLSLAEAWVGQADKIANDCLRDMDHRQQAPTFVEERIVSIARSVLPALGVTVHDAALFDKVANRVAPHVEAYSALISERTRVVTALRTAAQGDDDTRKTNSSEPEPVSRLAAKILKAREVRTALERQRTQICLGCAKGLLAGPQHAKSCPGYATQENAPNYAGTRRPGESSLDFGIRVHKALEEAQTEPPPAPVVVRPECPCCRSEEISYNTRADVWRCPVCSWSRRQLIEPPPGPKFKIGDWVVVSKEQNGRAPAQVMSFCWSTSAWSYTLLRETGPRTGVETTIMGESRLSLDPYRQAAAKMFGKPVAHVTQEERQAAKLQAFKDAYSAAPPSEFYKPQSKDEIRMLAKPPSWSTR
jgi:hypothetical protein